MTSSVKRPNFLNSILQALLVVNIIGFVAATIWMFITSYACGVFACGSIACYCLVDMVGIILISRWHKAGAWMSLAATLCECCALSIWGFPLPSSPVSPETIDCLLSIIVICVFIITVAPLFVLKAKPSGKMIWSVMKSGMDVKHCRHIYQLTSVLLAGIVLTMCFYRPAATTPVEPTPDLKEAEGKVEAPRTVDYTLLDSVNVTLNEVVSIEAMIDSIPGDSRPTYNKRIFALKHVLLSGLMSDNRNTQNLKNICKIHAGEFSNEQQRVLDWYLNLPQTDQDVWLDCPSVDNLSDFEKELKKRIITKSK